MNRTHLSVCTALLLTFVHPLAGCGGDSSASNEPDAGIIGPDAGAGDGGVDDTGGGLPPCLDSSECRGGEVCRDGRCREFCGADDPCVGALGVCDVASNVCVGCLTDTDCTGASRCEGQVCTFACTSASDCSPEQGCDPATGQCNPAECTLDADCPGGFRCAERLCVSIDPQICEPGDTRCAENTLETCAADGARWRSEPCGTDALCAGEPAACREIVCEPGTVACDGNAVTVCNADGTDLTRSPCGDEERCEAGSCEALVCTPDEARCDGVNVVQCDSLGSAESVTSCSAPGACTDTGAGCTCSAGACTARACAPTAVRCVGNATQVCAEDGLSFGPPQACPASTACTAGACLPTTCTPGESRCSGNTVLRCNADGRGWTPTDCAASGDTCVVEGGAAGCSDPLCEPLAVFCDDLGNVATCAADGNSVATVACDPGDVCVSGTCIASADACTPNARFCSAGDVRVCNAVGTGSTLAEDCGALPCADGACADPVCTPGSARCSGTQSLVCDAGGAAETATDCALSGQRCNPGTGRCVARVCDPTAPAFCSASDVVRCNADGSALEVLEACGAVGCSEGACLSSCATAQGLLGCEFWTADFDQIEDLTCSIFSPCTVDGACVDSVCADSPGVMPAVLAVSNPGTTTVSISITRSSDSSNIYAGIIAPGEATFIELPRLDVVGTQLSSRTFRLESSAPVAAWHFSPLSSVYEMVSGDSSRLVPTRALGTAYRHTGWPVSAAGGSTFAIGSYIIATNPGTTTVTVRPPVSIAAGTGVTALTAGAERTFALSQGQILALTPTSTVGGTDLTGMAVTASAPVAMFMGSRCANIPDNVTYCDHLFEQLLPTSAWGTRYGVARSEARGTEPDIIRVTAGTSTATVTVSAPRPGASAINQTLAAGTSATFEIFQSALVTATQPIHVAQTFVSTNYPSTPGGTCIETAERTGCAITEACGTRTAGDPAYLSVTPLDRARNRHEVWVPSQYPQNWVSVFMPSGASLLLDGSSVLTSRTTIAGIWQTTVFAVSPGPHTITSSQPISVMQHGWSCGGSYGHAGEATLP